jgi:hypothetical protein
MPNAFSSLRRLRVNSMFRRRSIRSCILSGSRTPWIWAISVSGTVLLLQQLDHVCVAHLLNHLLPRGKRRSSMPSVETDLLTKGRWLRQFLKWVPRN